MHEVETGTIAQQQYRDEFEKYIRKQISTIKEKHKDYTPEKPQAKNTPCELSDMLANRSFQLNTGINAATMIKKPVAAFLLGEICGKRLTEKQMCDLIQKQKNSRNQRIQVKNGKSFNAALILESTNKISFDFSSGGTDGS